MPLRFELSRRQVPQSGVDSLVLVDLTQEPAQLTESTSIVPVLRQVNFLFLDGADKTLGISIPPGFSHLGHADLHVSVPKYLGVGRRRVLGSLVGMMDSRGLMMHQRPVQGEQGQRLVQAAPYMPPSDAAGEHVHNHRQVHELDAQPDVRDVRHPNLIKACNLQVLYQVGIAGKVVLAVCRLPLLALDPSLQVHLLHQTAHTFVIDHPALAAQLGRDATIAVG